VRDKVLHTIRERGLLHAGDRVAVAVSGGADSIALLRVLLELRALSGIVLTVAHYNHGLRGEASDADEQFVTELARQFDVPFFTGRGNVREHAITNKTGIEHAAREMRYQWLLDLAGQQRFQAIATAHTADDQAETVLMKFLRGAGTRGLAGIHPVLRRDSVRIVRPLVEATRTDVERYLTSIKQPWREDESNRDLSLTRNRIRRELLALLERDYNPNLRVLLSKTADIAVAEEDYWQHKVESFLDQWLQEPGRLRLYEMTCFPGGLLIESVAMQRRVLKCFLECRGFTADFHHVELVRRCALGGTTQVVLPGGWLAKREGDWLELMPPSTHAPDVVDRFEHFLPVPGKCVISEARLTLRATIVPAEVAASEAPGSLLRLLRFGQKLTIRNWHPGDRYRPAHTGSEEKLKRLFSEKRIPADQRPLWPVALSGSRIVWVRGFLPAHDSVWVSGQGDAFRIDVSGGE
jgi:tRNA(Ile)-lysidine synthase